jgi:hypothetical protein
MIVAISLTSGVRVQNAHSTTLYQQALRAVCHYFKGAECATAMRIVKCETGGSYTPWSANGQYRGIFQMGSWERATYGDGNNVWAQARAAYRYFLDAGFGPWLNYEPPGCGS